jgi:hypothetical protein
VAREVSVEKLWRYADLARLWSWALIGTAGLLLALSVAIQAGSDDGLDARWIGIVLGVTGGTGVVMYPLLRVWLRRAALPSLRLEQATRATGPRRLEAGPADWRRWAVLTALVLVVGGAALLTFLIGVLGRGGTAEGVVVGTLAAWGLATLEDARRIRATEAEEGRRYYAACRRPTGVGNKLVWMTEKDVGRAAARAEATGRSPGGA